MKLLIPPPLQAIICAACMWSIASIFPSLNFSFGLQQSLAILICLIGIGIDLLSVGLFARVKTTVSPFSPDKTSSLVTSGMYQYTRNPMYFGMLLILTGIAIWLGNIASFIMLPIFVWFITNLQIIPEEQILIEKFGEEYGDYMMRVRRWI